MTFIVNHVEILLNGLRLFLFVPRATSLHGSFTVYDYMSKLGKRVENRRDVFEQISRSFKLYVID